MDSSTADELSTAAQAIAGRPVWRAWRGYGSFLFLEMGEPLITVSKTTRNYTVSGNRVRWRQAFVYGTYGVSIQMAQWKLLAEEDVVVAHSDSSDAVFEQLLKWIQGQHLVELSRSGLSDLALRFDLGAKFELSPTLDADPDQEQIVIWHGDLATALRADGKVWVRPSSGERTKDSPQDTKDQLKLVE